MKMTPSFFLEFIKDTPGIYGKVYKKGEIIEYIPWNYEFHDMDEVTRIKNGIYVHCYGHGEFDRFEEGKDVRRRDAR